MNIITRKQCFIFLLLACLSFSLSCSDETNGADFMIHTKYGDIFVKLYEDTPIHRENFLKKIDDNFFTGKSFFRVVEDALIQGGGKDPFPEGDLRNYLKPEISEKRIHKTGAFCVPRFDDSKNPERLGSASQFYIALGRPFNDSELDTIEKEITYKNFNLEIFKYKAINRKQLISEFEKKSAGKWTIEKDLRNMASKDPRKYEVLMARLNEQLDSLIMKDIFPKPKYFKYTEEQRSIYKKTGGTPELDLQYTVFGEVVKGIEVAYTISKSVTHPNSELPMEGIGMKIIRVK